MAIPKAGSRHWNFYVAAAVGLLVAVVTALILPRLFPALAACAFSLTYLVLVGRDLRMLTPAYLKDRADEEDAPPLVVFLLTFAIVVYVTVALFLAVNDKQANPLTLGLGAASGALSWLMIHVLWGMHYAWEYYEAPEGGRTDEAPQKGGLDFPGDDLPDGMAFIYFSLVIAMTAQTSDTDVINNKMRRIVSGHSLFSYVFNTVIVAAAVNVVLSLAGQ